MIKAVVTPAQYNMIQRTLANDKLSAKKKAIRWFIDNLLMEHFQAGNTERYGYEPNKPAYDAWKRKHGNNIQLVMSGELKAAVETTARVNPNGTFRVDVPKYGIYQIELGRDFLEPNSKELTLINRQFRKFLKEIRKKTVETIMRKY